jgi:ATP-dependent phosphoenolpyruvate carboxykinase
MTGNYSAAKLPLPKIRKEGFMSAAKPMMSKHGLEIHGIKNTDTEHWNLSTPALYEEAMRRREGIIAHLGPLVVRTGHHTGRSPNDKYIVKEPSSEGHIWWGKVNRPFAAGNFDNLYERCLSYLQGKDVFVQDCFAGADPRYRCRFALLRKPPGTISLRAPCLFPARGRSWRA